VANNKRSILYGVSSYLLCTGGEVMEWFYKLLCCLGLAKVDHFKVKVGQHEMKHEEIINKPYSRMLILFELQKHGAPVLINSTRNTYKVKKGFYIERVNCPPTLAFKFVWYRLDYRYVLHPMLRFKGVK
jgi:hypothetical protein